MPAIYIRVTNLMKIYLTLPSFPKPYGKMSLNAHTCSFGEDNQTRSEGKMCSLGLLKEKKKDQNCNIPPSPVLPGANF